MINQSLLERVWNVYVGDPSHTYETTALALGLRPHQVRDYLKRYRELHNISIEEMRQLKASREPSPPTPAPDSIYQAEALSNDMMRDSLSIAKTYAARISASYPHTMLRSAVFDIETTSFTATGLRGFLICCSILPLEQERPYTLALRYGEQAGRDRRLVQETIEELSQYDILIGHAIDWFDLPWLNTRADYHGLPPLRTWIIIDTYQLARNQRLRTSRKTLAHLLDHFRMEVLKTQIYPCMWEDIRSDDQDIFEQARDLIVEHCELDVITNRALFDRLMPGTWRLRRPPFKMTGWAGLPEVPDVQCESESA